jgi:hypothetical protein
MKKNKRKMTSLGSAPHQYSNIEQKKSAKRVCLGLVKKKMKRGYRSGSVLMLY